MPPERLRTSCGGTDILGSTRHAPEARSPVVDWVANGRMHCVHAARGFLAPTASPTSSDRNDRRDGAVLDSEFRDRRTRPAPRRRRGIFYVLPSSTQVLPDFETLEAYGSSVHGRIDFESTGGDFADTGRNDDFGVVWTGWIDIPNSGFWTLGTRSDDGSRLYIGDELVVDNDGLHGMQSRTGRSASTSAARSESSSSNAAAGRLHRAGRWPRDGLRRRPRIDVVPRRHHGAAADLDGDGAVNGADLGLLLAGWNQPGPTDLDGDGTTNGADLGLLLAAFD